VRGLPRLLADERVAAPEGVNPLGEGLLGASPVSWSRGTRVPVESLVAMMATGSGGGTDRDAVTYFGTLHPHSFSA
jgi:hypothetical protein